jgi:hypothetical protein
MKYVKLFEQFITETQGLGKLAYVQGKDVDDNPFKPGTKEHVDWIKGYAFAQDRRLRKAKNESSVNERRASMVGRVSEPDYTELMDLLDMAKQYADANLFRGKDFMVYWNDDYVMFDNPSGAAVGYDKRDVRKKDIFPGKSEAVSTFKKANYNPEETIKQVEKHFKGKVTAELAKWQGEIIGVNYKFN